MNVEKIKTLHKFGKSLRILYVEDNTEARESTLDVLHDIFHDITVALDGIDGLEKFQSEHFDLVITDINMPKLNGIDMVEKIRDKDADVPILITSAYSDSGYFMETIKLGVEGYLLKPIDLEQFIDALTKALEKIKLRTENEQYKQELEKENQTLSKNIKSTTELLQKQMFTDQLTGLQNRAALDRDIETHREKDGTSLILLDINNFKNFNALYELDTGNSILKHFAKELGAGDIRFPKRIPGFRRRIRAAARPGGFLLRTAA